MATILTVDQLDKRVNELRKEYPNLYSYTDNSTWNLTSQFYLVFRNRDESFDKDNAIERIEYKY